MNSRVSTDRRRAGMRRMLGGLGLMWLCACGGSPGPESQMGARPAAAQDAGAGWNEALERPGTRPLPPAGFGTLSQDAITVGLEKGTLLIKAVPLTEWVIRLTAPDTHRRLNGYKVSQGEEILRRARRNGESGWPLVMFVTFYTRALEESYEPHDLQIRSQNFLIRPLDIVPVTPGFTRERLRQQESQIALYLFPGDVDLDLEMVVEYQGVSGSRWGAIRSVLDAELSLVLSRAGAGED